MKITLKRVILCGAMLLAAIFFLLVLVVKIDVSYGVKVLGEYPFHTKNSYLGASGSNGFHDAFYWGFVQSSIVSGDVKEAASILAKGADGTLKVMSIMGLVFVIIDILAIVGAFFLKTQKGARKLIIPFMAISIVLMFLVIVLPGALLNQTVSAMGMSASVGEGNIGPLWIVYFIAVGLFIGALVAAGVVKDKVLVGDKK